MVKERSGWVGSVTADPSCLEAALSAPLLAADAGRIIRSHVARLQVRHFGFLPHRVADRAAEGETIVRMYVSLREADGRLVTATRSAPAERCLPPRCNRRTLVVPLPQHECRRLVREDRDTADRFRRSFRSLECWSSLLPKPDFACVPRNVRGTLASRLSDITAAEEGNCEDRKRGHENRAHGAPPFSCEEQNCCPLLLVPNLLLGTMYQENHNVPKRRFDMRRTYGIVRIPEVPRIVCAESSKNNGIFI